MSNGTLLRELRESDAERVFEQATDPLTVEFTPVPVPYTRSDALDYITAARVAAEAGTEHVFAIDHGGRFGGSCSLRVIGPHRAEVGYGLHPDARGRGLATAALNEILRFGWEDLDLRQVTWRAKVGNTASLVIAQRVGFRVRDELGTLRQRGEEVPAWRATLKRSWHIC